MMACVLWFERPSGDFLSFVERSGGEIHHVKIKSEAIVLCSGFVGWFALCNLYGICGDMAYGFQGTTGLSRWKDFRQVC